MSANGTALAEKETAWKVKLPAVDLEALRRIAERIGQDKLIPQPSIHALIRKAVRNYITEAGGKPTRTLHV